MSTQTVTAPRTAAKPKALPQKTTLNLMMREKSELAPSRWLPWAIVIIVLAALFGKFAVADRFARLNAAESALRAKQDQLAALEQSYADYDEVKSRYDQYTYSGYDKTIADRQEILDLLERDVLPYSVTRTVSVNGNVFSTTLTGLTLDEVSAMMAKLEADPLVDGVTVFTAGYDDPGTYTETGAGTGTSIEPYATMTIVFKNAEGGAEQ